MRLEEESRGRPPTRLILALVALIAAVGLSAVAANSAGAKSKKVTNPLAGRYAGQTTEGYPVSFTITKSGSVLGFAPTVLVTLQSGNPCPGLATATVSAPSLRLTKPSPGYPKGKQFKYVGPGGSPPGTIGTAKASPAPGIIGKVPGLRFKGVLVGKLTISGIQVGENTCGSGRPQWTATKK